MTLGRWLTKSPIATFFGVLFCLLAMPVLLPLGMIAHVRSQRRLKTLVGKLPCVNCGALLGGEALRIADERWAKEVQQRQAASPGSIVGRMIRRVHAVCPHCDCEYTYFEKENMLMRKDLVVA